MSVDVSNILKGQGGCSTNSECKDTVSPGDWFCALWKDEDTSIYSNNLPAFFDVKGCTKVHDMTTNRFAWGKATTPYHPQRGCKAMFFSPETEEFQVCDEGGFQLKDGFRVSEIIISPGKDAPADAVGSVCVASVRQDGKVELKRLENGERGAKTPFNVLILGSSKAGRLRLITNVTGRAEPSWIVDVPREMIVTIPMNVLIADNATAEPAGCSDERVRNRRGQMRKRARVRAEMGSVGNDPKSKKSKILSFLDRSLGIMSGIMTHLRGEEE